MNVKQAKNEETYSGGKKIWNYLMLLHSATSVTKNTFATCQHVRFTNTFLSLTLAKENIFRTTRITCFILTTTKHGSTRYQTPWYGQYMFHSGFWP